MTRRQRKVREVRMAVWKILSEWKLILGISLLMLTLVLTSVAIAAVTVLVSDAIFHFTHNTQDTDNWIAGITILTILALIAFFSWYYGDEEED